MDGRISICKSFWVLLTIKTSVTESKINIFAHVIKSYKEKRGIAPRILNLVAGWRKVAIIVVWPLYST
jgi:hypothetical protein